MSLLAACNPLLDVVADVPRALLDEYELAPGGAVLANEKQLTLFPRVSKELNCKYLLGGCGQNTVRVYQALSKGTNNKFLGCVGNDKDAKQLQALMEEQGIKTLYKVSEDKLTGSCLVLVTDKERSLCTRLGACVDIDEAFLDSCWSEVAECDAIYCTGFLLSSCTQVLLRMARHCRSSGKLFACNLSADFLMQQFKEEYLEMLGAANIVCGNRTEFTKFAEINGLEATRGVGEIASQVLGLMVRDLEGAPNTLKMAVVTQGADPVIIASRPAAGGVSIGSYPVPELAADKIVDLNGAGDAFVGGLLYGVLKGMCTDACVDIGSWCAAHVIQQSGFQFDPTGCPYIK